MVGEEATGSADSLTGDIGGVDARNAEGERSKGDSGRLNGDGRGEPHDSGEGFLGDVDAGCGVCKMAVLAAAVRTYKHDV